MNGPAGTVFVVDDDAAVLESIEALLASLGHETEGFTSAQAFLARFDPSRAACVLLDVRMPGLDGLMLLERLDPARTGVPVIMVTGYGDVPMAVRAMQAGAMDFVEKPFDPERLAQSIERALTTGTAASAAADPGLRDRFLQLTPRESEVMRELVIGHPNKIIAHNLGMSPRTVEIHRARVMEKTGAESLSHLVRMAMKAGYDPEAGA